MPCDVEQILKITKKYKLKLIEDCAHSIETKYKGLHVGNLVSLILASMQTRILPQLAKVA